jgi:hypothetical protein
VLRPRAVTLRAGAVALRSHVVVLRSPTVVLRGRRWCCVPARPRCAPRFAAAAQVLYLCDENHTPRHVDDAALVALGVPLTKS